MKRRIAYLLLVGGLAFSFVITLLPTPRAHAQAGGSIQLSDADVQNATFAWVNNSAIVGTFGSQTIEFDSTVSSASRLNTSFAAPYKAVNYPCTAHEQIAPTDIRDPSTATLDLSYNLPGKLGSACSSRKTKTITIGATANQKIYFTLSGDLQTVSGVGSQGKIFTRLSATSNTYVLQNSTDHGATSACPDVIIVDGSETSYILYEMHKGSGTAAPDTQEGPGCNQDSSHTHPNDPHGIGAFAGTSLPLGITANTTATTTPSGNSDNLTPGITCDWSKNPLNWVMCPILQGVQDLMNGVGQTINNYLTVPTRYFDTSQPTGSAIFTAWSSIRDIALILLGITALIMILSQALSFGPFDAYTIKKLLPRILIAAILITLSWSIIQLMVSGSNVLGDSVRTIIEAPFSSLKNVDFNANILSVGLVGGLGVLGGLGILGVLSLGLTGALALLIALVVIVIRQMVVILLAILAPAAIVLYILPGTSKAWDLWWDSFSGALLMYPIIVGFIAIGAVFSRIAAISGAGSGATKGTIDQVIAFAALYLPYFLLPATVRFAGGAISSLGGMVNDRGRGAFDRLKGFRKNQVAKNWQDTKAGNRFKSNNFISKKASSALQTATLAGAGGATLDMNQRRARVQAARNSRNFDTAMKFLEENESARAIANDDDKLWAAKNGVGFEGIKAELQKRAPGRFTDPAELNRAAAEVSRFQRESGGAVGKIAATVANAGTGTGYNYSEVPGVEDDMINAILDTSGGDMALAGRMLGKMRPMASQSGRPGLAGGGFAKTMQVMGKRRAALAGDPSSPSYYSTKDAEREILEDVLQSNAGAAVAGKMEDVKRLAPVMRAQTDAAIMSGDADLAAREFAKLAGKHDAASQIAPQNAEALDAGVLGKTIDIDIATMSPQMRDLFAPFILQQDANGTVSSRVGNLGITYQQAIDSLRGTNEAFGRMRRDYQTGAQNAAAQMAAAGMSGAPAGIPTILPPGGGGGPH